MEEDQIYYVEKLLGKKLVPDEAGNEQPYYLVKWLGWSNETNTWEPLENLKCPELICEYESRVDSNKSNGTDDNFIDKEAWGDSKDILEKVPCNMYATRVISVVPQTGELLYVIELKRNNKPDDGSSSLALIKPYPFKEEYPDVLIQYYENNTKLCDDKRDETTIAVKAEQALAEYQNRFQNGDANHSSESDEERGDVKLPLLDSETSSDEQSTSAESESDDMGYTYTKIFPEDD